MKHHLIKLRTEKGCYQCKKKKPLAEFSFCKRSADGYEYICKECNRIRLKEYKTKVKIEVLTHYSFGRLECVLCGETSLSLLSIDHIYGGGKKHREEIGTNGSVGFYNWLKRNQYPSGYRTLCMNCQHQEYAEQLVLFLYQHILSILYPSVLPTESAG